MTLASYISTNQFFTLLAIPTFIFSLLVVAAGIHTVITEPHAVFTKHFFLFLLLLLLCLWQLLCN